MSERLVTVLGSLAGCEALGTALLGTTALDLLEALAHPATPRLDPAMGVAAAGTAWLVLTWLVTTTALAAAAQWSAGRPGPRGPGRGALVIRLADRCSPELARRVAAVLLGAGLVAATGSGGPALAHEHAPVVQASAAPGPSGVDSLDRPAADADGRPAPRPGAEARGEAADEIVVQRGDTLWGIAARQLGPAAAAADIAAEWPRWYAANRGEIGPDPDLLHPGQRLQPPTS